MVNSSLPYREALLTSIKSPALFLFLFFLQNSDSINIKKYFLYPFQFCVIHVCVCKDGFFVQIVYNMTGDCLMCAHLTVARLDHKHNSLGALRGPSSFHPESTPPLIALFRVSFPFSLLLP